jgi:hypothetical protein
MARLLETDRTIMKRVTIQEAIKANEHSRVRRVGFDWYEVKSFEKLSGFIYEDILADWEIEERSLELWANIYNDTSMRVFNTKEYADAQANGRIRCVKMREVTDE